MSKPFNPQITVFTNEMLDKIMRRVSGSAWKILCAAMRKTVGWADERTESGRKEWDIISFSQFEEITGMSRPTVKAAIDECVQKNYLLQVKVGQTFKYRINTDYELPEEPTSKESLPVKNPTSKESLPVTSKESLQTNSNINSNKDYDARKQAYLESIARSVAIGMTRGGGELGGYPEDIREVLLVFSELWNIKPPARNSKSSKAYWIEGGRELLDACAELGTDVLREVRKDFEQHMSAHHGAPPFTVSSPKSLVNPARAKAGMLRNYPKTPVRSPVISAPELWIGGERYVNGVKASA